MITAKSTRLDRIPVLLIVLAIFGQDLVWSFYDAQVPASLRAYVSSATVIGMVMSVDNVVAVVVQPWVGHLSDRYRRRRGTRLPFLVVGAPLAAVPFVLIPQTSSLAQLLACVVCFALLANGFEGVTETLLPDHVPPGCRSRAHGFVKVATSLTVTVAAALGLLVVDGNLELAFAIPAVSMVVRDVSRLSPTPTLWARSPHRPGASLARIVRWVAPVHGSPASRRPTASNTSG